MSYLDNTYRLIAKQRKFYSFTKEIYTNEERCLRGYLTTPKAFNTFEKNENMNFLSISDQTGR